MDAGLVVVALLMLAGKKTSASKAATAKEGKSDGDSLVKRANQARALAWADTFMGLGGMDKRLADSLARWAGLESSGDPLATSPIGERGLLQTTATTALKEKALTSKEWDDLQRPTTTRAEHARINYNLANWLLNRALKHVTNPPNDSTSGVWYAKLYHQRPVDVRDAHMHGPALAMARELADTWKNDAAKMHRLRAANVVAFGMPNP